MRRTWTLVAAAIATTIFSAERRDDGIDEHDDTDGMLARDLAAERVR